MWYLQPAVHLLGVQEVADERSLPAQHHGIGGASLHPAQRRDAGGDVCVAKEGGPDPLALARLQHPVQRQDVEHLEGGEETATCGASALMQKNRGLEQRTDMAGEFLKHGQNHPNLILHPFHSPGEEPWEKIISHTH